MVRTARRLTTPRALPNSMTACPAIGTPSHPRFHIHFTPTGSSWISQVERWFGYLTDQKLRRGVHKSVQALEADIRDWIEHRNDNPRPFAWAKTAEENLNSLAEYLSKISGERH
jgi:transposase